MNIENQQPDSRNEQVTTQPSFFDKAVTTLRQSVSGRALYYVLAALQVQAAACNNDNTETKPADTYTQSSDVIIDGKDSAVATGEDPTTTSAPCPQDQLYYQFKELDVTLDQCKSCHRPGGVGYKPEINSGWQWDASGNPIASGKSFDSLFKKAARFTEIKEPYWVAYAKGVTKNTDGSGKTHGGGEQSLDNGQVAQMSEFTKSVRAYVQSLGNDPDAKTLPDAPKVNVDCKNTQYSEEKLFEGMEMLSLPEVYVKFLRNVTGAKIPTSPLKITTKDQLRQMMMLATEDLGFYEWLKTNYNDETLTQALAKDDKAIKALGTSYGIDWTKRDNAELADGPGNLLVYIVKHNRSIKELGTATYIVDPGIKPINGGFDDWVGRQKAQNITTDTAPLAGVPSDRIWLTRWPSTETNINRNRSRLTHEGFYDMDILKFGSRNVQQNDPNATYPTLTDKNCITCHRGTPLDLGSRAFTKFDLVTGKYNPNAKEPAPISLLNMGLYGQEIKHNAPNALQQLMYLMTLDPDLSPSDPGYDPDRRRPFAKAMAKMSYKFLMQRDPSEKPNDGEMDFEAKMNRYMSENKFLNEMATFLHDNGYNFRKLVAEMAMSKWFSASGEMTTGDELTSKRTIELANVGPVLATPEQLAMRLKGLLGPDVEKFGLTQLIKGAANVELGGIDSIGVVTRQKDPTSIYELRIDAIALDNVGKIVVADLAKKPNERHLFKALSDWDNLKLESPVQPGTNEVNKSVELKYKQTMAVILLHKHGKYFDVNSKEVQDLFNEWVKIWNKYFDTKDNDNIVSTHQVPGVDPSDKFRIIRTWVTFMAEIIQSIEFTTSQNDAEDPSGIESEKIAA